MIQSVYYHPCQEVNTLDKKLQFFKKQIALPDIGIEGQNKLLSAKVLVIGAGALGGNVLIHLVSIGVGEIGICDGDKVEISNLHRQILFDLMDVGKNKARTASQKVKWKNPFSTIVPYDFMVDSLNINSLAGGYDIIVDCTDNYLTKYMLHDYCYTSRKQYIQGGIYQYNGEVFSFPFSQRNIDDLACCHCLRKRIPQKLDRNVSEYGVISPVPGLIALIQVMETAKLIVNNNIAESVSYVVSAHFDYSITKIRCQKNENCSFCGKKNFR